MNGSSAKALAAAACMASFMEPLPRRDTVWRSMDPAPKRSREEARLRKALRRSKKNARRRNRR